MIIERGRMTTEMGGMMDLEMKRVAVLGDVGDW